MSDPDFYLASTDFYNLEEPRRVWRVKRMSSPYRDDLLLARIAPPLLGDEYGGPDVELVLIATRHKGSSLFPIRQWPVYVHVALPLVDNIESRDRLQGGEYQSIAWGELYRTEGDALKTDMEGANG